MTSEATARWLHKDFLNALHRRGTDVRAGSGTNTIDKTLSFCLFQSMIMMVGSIQFGSSLVPVGGLSIEDKRFTPDT
jgi:hypothetical protein